MNQLGHILVSFAFKSGKKRHRVEKFLHRQALNVFSQNLVLFVRGVGNHYSYEFLFFFLLNIC